MYSRDCIAIVEHASKSPKGLLDVIEFTLCSIQAGLSTIKLQRKDIFLHGAGSKYLWGKKADGYRYATDNLEYLWPKLMALRECGLDNEACIADAVLLLMHIPGLGMVKASFVAQMLGFDVACLDSHNITRSGVNPNLLKVSAKLSATKKREKVLAYIKLCNDLSMALHGETCSEYWWNSWCEYVAGNRANKLLNTADVVSKYHYDAIMME
jgi:hypothetical protein